MKRECRSETCACAHSSEIAEPKACAGSLKRTTICGNALRSGSPTPISSCCTGIRKCSVVPVPNARNSKRTNSPRIIVPCVKTSCSSTRTSTPSHPTRRNTCGIGAPSSSRPTAWPSKAITRKCTRASYTGIPRAVFCASCGPASTMTTIREVIENGKHRCIRTSVIPAMGRPQPSETKWI